MGNSFLTKEEAMRLYKVVKGMPIPYEYSPYSTDQSDTWDMYISAFKKFIISAVHLTEKFSLLGENWDENDVMRKAAHFIDYGEGYIDWYSSYGGASAVLEGCALMADSLAGAEYFAGYVFGCDEPIGDIAARVIKELENSNDEYLVSQPAFDDEFEFYTDDDECYDEYACSVKLAREFAEGICEMTANPDFSIFSNQSISDLFKVVCNIYGLEKDEEESIGFFKKHIKEFLVCIFGSGRVHFESVSGSTFSAMVSCNFWCHKESLPRFLKIRDKEELSEEEEAFMWAVYALATTYYRSEAEGLAEAVPVEDMLMFIRVEPQVADSSDGFDCAKPAYATVFAPLILDALSQEGGEQ